MLHLRQGVRQVVALDLVEVREGDDELASISGGHDLPHGGERRRLHRLGGAVHKKHRIRGLDAAAHCRRDRRGRFGRVAEPLAVEENELRNLASVPGRCEGAGDPHAVHEGRQQPPEEGRVVTGKARDRAQKRGALLDRPLSAPRQRPALPRLLDLAARQQVEALLDLRHQCIGHLVEPLVVPATDCPAPPQRAPRPRARRRPRERQARRAACHRAGERARAASPAFGRASPPCSPRRWHRAPSRKEDPARPPIPLLLIVEVRAARGDRRAGSEHVVEAETLIDMVE